MPQTRKEFPCRSGCPYFGIVKSDEGAILNCHSIPQEIQLSDHSVQIYERSIEFNQEAVLPFPCQAVFPTFLRRGVRDLYVAKG